MAIISAFLADDAGSIPADRSILSLPVCDEGLTRSDRRNSRNTFSVDGKVTYIQSGGAFTIVYNPSVQRDGFTTGTITITKVR